MSHRMARINMRFQTLSVRRSSFLPVFALDDWCLSRTLVNTVGIIYGAGIIGAVPRHCDCERLVEDGTGRRRRDGREATAAAADSERAGDVVVGVKGCAWVSEGAGDHSRTAVLDLNRTA
jgi:hypothetical protein